MSVFLDHRSCSFSLGSKARENAHCDRFLAIGKMQRASGLFRTHETKSTDSRAFPGTDRNIKDSQGKVMSNGKKSRRARDAQGSLGRACGYRACGPCHYDAVAGWRSARVARRDHAGDLSTGARSQASLWTPDVVPVVTWPCLGRLEAELVLNEPPRRRRLVAEYISRIIRGDD